MHLKMPSGRCRSFCLGFNVLRIKWKWTSCLEFVPCEYERLRDEGQTISDKSNLSLKNAFVKLRSNLTGTNEQMVQQTVNVLAWDAMAPMMTSLWL